MAKQNNSRCKAINSRGKRCGNDAKEGSEYCRIPSHNPSSPIKKGRWESFVAWINKYKNLIEITVLFVSVLIGIGTLFFGFNQGVQPLFSPRVSTFEKTPLFIQNDVSYSNKTLSQKFFLVYKITYDIEPPLFRKSRPLIVSLPKGNELFTPVSGFWDESPYIGFKEDYPSPPFIDTQKNKSITLIIKPKGSEIKKIPFTLYFREKVSNIECDYMYGLGSNYWWDKYNTDIETRPKVYCNYKFEPEVYGLYKGETVYDFDTIDIINSGSLDIRGFVINTYPKGVSTEVCQDGMELVPYWDTVEVDRIKGGEKIRIVVKHQLSKDDSEKHKNKVEFNFTSSNCDGDWTNYVT